MPKIIRVRLTPEQRDDLNQRARARAVASRLRERLEMVRLSDLGQTIPQMAQTLGAPPGGRDHRAAHPQEDQPRHPPRSAPAPCSARLGVGARAGGRGQELGAPAGVLSGCRTERQGVERRPQKKARWLRMEVTWTPEVRELLDQGLLTLGEGEALGAATPVDLRRETA